jgi:hypothetical protein
VERRIEPDMVDFEPDVDLDYALMYSQFSKEKRRYKEILHAVLSSWNYLEFAISELVNAAAIQEPELVPRKVAMKRVRIRAKLDALLKAGLISKDLHSNILLLARIRNKYAHEMPIPATELETEFKALEDARLKSEFLSALPNDSVKFELIASGCIHELIMIGDKRYPGSVLHLEYAGGGFTPIDE